MLPCQGRCREFEPRLPLIKKTCQQAGLFYWDDSGEKLQNASLSEKPDGRNEVSPVSECEVDGNEVKSTVATSVKVFQESLVSR